MMQVRFHPEAEREVVEHEVWYRERSEFAAQGFLLELNSAVMSVAESPERWPEHKRGERCYILPHTLSRFSIESEAIMSSSLLFRIRAAGLVIGVIASERGTGGSGRPRASLVSTVR